MDKEQCQAWMKAYFEQYYDQLSERDAMFVTLPDVPPEMWAKDTNADEEWRKWKLVPSTMTEEDLDQLEKQVGVAFPMIFRAFLSTYFHCFEAGIGKNSTSTPFESVKNAWNPLLVKAGYLPFAWDEEYHFIRCLKLDAMPNEENCGVYQIDHERLFDFDESRVKKEEIDAQTEFVAENFIVYLKQQFARIS